MAVVRAVRSDELWDGFDVGKGFLPFARFRGVQVADYLRLDAPLDHLVIAHDGYDFETPGARWLALNPAVGRALKWQPIEGDWFRWVNGQGDIVVESIWWSDGRMHRFDEHQRVEVGNGWLVLVTEQGFEEIMEWAPQVTRGGVVRRSTGWCGSAGQHYATGVLAL